MTKPPQKLAKTPKSGLPSDLVTLSDPSLLKDLEIKATKGVYQMKLRSEQRVANGSKEKPFPLPYERIGSTYRYSRAEIVAWRAGHTQANNPSRKTYVAPKL